jgi:hypothetical protein
MLEFLMVAFLSGATGVDAMEDEVHVTHASYAEINYVLREGKEGLEVANMQLIVWEVAPVYAPPLPDDGSNSPYRYAIDDSDRAVGTLVRYSTGLAIKGYFNYWKNETADDLFSSNLGSNRFSRARIGRDLEKGWYVWGYCYRSDCFFRCYVDRIEKTWTRFDPEIENRRYRPTLQRSGFNRHDQ